MMFGLGLCLSGWKGKSVHFRNSGSGCVLTPHVLSEWMVEVCRFDKCGVRLGFDLVWCSC